MITLDLDPLVIVLTITSWGFQLIMYLTSWLIQLFPYCPLINPDKQIEKIEHDYAIMIPCLNEETVITGTLDQFTKQSYNKQKIHVFIINDGSDDNTKEVVETWIKNYQDESGNIESQNKINYHLFNIPHFIEQNGKQVKFARQGKSIALNRCFTYIDNECDNISKDNLIIGIVDGDGKLDVDIIERANRKFWIPNVGGVNSSIRIKNTHSLWDNLISLGGNCKCFIKEKKVSLWTICQDIEFLVIARLGNWIRGRFLDNAFMGGNGQFMRYEVLKQLEEEDGYVWSYDALTEDMDIGIRAYMKGWKGKQLFSTFVRQEGLNDIRSLWRQRTRWSWGNVQVFFRYCINLKILWNTKYTSIFSRLDTLFLLSNSFFWMILIPLSFILSILYWSRTIELTFTLSPLLMWVNGLVWLVFPFIGILSEKEYRWRVIPCTLLYFVYVFIFSLTFIPAYYNVITCKKVKWAKTAREAETNVMKTTKKIMVQSSLKNQSELKKTVNENEIIPIIERIDSDMSRESIISLNSH